jgi:serine/threonine protein kinase
MEIPNCDPVPALYKHPAFAYRYAVPSNELQAGDLLRGFRIEGYLGEGAMGKVYRARRESDQLPVALKVLPPSSLEDPYAKESFLIEMEITAQLSHPQLIHSVASGAADGMYFLALKYIEGETVEAYGDRKGPLNEDESLYLIHYLAGAMQYAWETHRVIHRDINPSNIILSLEGYPVLVDLGMAQYHRQPLSATLDGLVEGTPNYMSPEQSRNNPDIDYRTDVYGLGASLYRAVTGHIPFAEFDEDEVLNRLRSDDLILTDPRRYNPSVSNACVLLIERMLAKHPIHRCTSWQQLVQDIDRVLGGKAPAQGPLPQEQSMLKREGFAKPSARRISVMKRSASGTVRRHEGDIGNKEGR